VSISAAPSPTSSRSTRRQGGARHEGVDRAGRSVRRLHGRIAAGLRRFGIAPDAVEFTVHGTTVATNTIILGKGARAGLITSAGFSDVLEIAYQTRPVLYEIDYEKPAPLIPRQLSIGVGERIGPDGEVIVPLDERGVVDAARRLRDAAVEAIAIAFLHAYRDPTHEHRADALIREALPGLPVILSSDVCPEYREYPRTSTTVVNAVLVPRIGPYIARLEQRLAAAGLRCGLHLMTSSGGIMASGIAHQFRVHLVESGPAAGVIGAAFVAEMTSWPAAFRKAISLDIGGTTAKAALIDDGKPALADEFEVGAAAVPTMTASRGQGYPVKTPVISLLEIGAGGGSIAHIDPGGALTVGPESAGADPGPACYGKGGDRPTVTDANLVFGRLNAEYFLGGALTVDRSRVEAALTRDVGRPFGLDLRAAARAVIDIANAKMVAALQFISIQRGLDPRDYTLVPSGGAGAMHAVAIAAALGVKTVLVPPTPGLNSALGLLAERVRLAREDLDEPLAIAAPQRPLDVAMQALEHRELRAVMARVAHLHRVDQVGKQPRVVEHAAMEIDEAVVARAPRDAHAEGDVPEARIEKPSRPQHRPLLRLHVDDLGEEAGIVEVAVESRQPLGDAIRLRELVDLVDVERVHEDAMIGLDPDQPFGCQAIERLADRRSAELELLRQVLGVDRLGGRQRQVEDAVADHAGGGIDERLVGWARRHRDPERRRLFENAGCSLYPPIAH